MITVRSVADLNATIVRQLHLIPRNVDAIVGIPRSGMLAASLIALHLQKPLSDVEGFCRNEVFRRSTRVVTARRILLVDDTVLKGTAMRDAVTRIGQGRPDAQVIRLAVWAALHTPPGSADLALDICPCPRAFAWNLWRHKRMPRWAFDLDGVLCRDPRRDENDDGDAYLQFIRTAEPLFVPKRPIGWIVTARLEKWRAATEVWLRQQGIAFGQLIMLDLPDAATRQATGGRGSWKAGVFRNLPAELFIESNAGQASKIAKGSGKPVWCTSTQTFIRPPALGGWS